MKMEMATARGREAASLRDWLRFYADKSAGQGARVSRTALRVLESAFPSAFAEASRGTEAEWEVVTKTLEVFYEAPLGVDVAALPCASFVDSDCTSAPFVRLLELVLGAVIQSEEKAAFVRDIMTMDASVQVDLMATIEKMMAHGANSAVTAHNRTSEGEGDGEGAVLSGSSISETRSPFHQRVPGTAAGFSSPLHLSTKADFEHAKRENAVLRDENIHISEELNDARHKLQCRQAENEALTSRIQEITQERERDLLRKEHSVRALLDDRIQLTQRELETVTAELQIKAAIASTVPALRDEIDLLRPMAERVGKMDGKLAKYKAKIEELVGVKDKLRIVERANEELMSKNLALESRIAKSAALQRKLDEAKEANTAAEFRVSELESLLSRQGHELATLKGDLEVSENALQETRTLNRQLQEAITRQLSDGGMSQSESLGDGASTAIAGGISELNPELMQKLQRLEYENNELKKQVDGETSERIDNLLDEVADVTRLKKSFEGRYFDAVRQLEETQAQLEGTQNREAQLNAVLAETQEGLRNMTLLRNESDEALTKAREDIDNLRATETRLEGELCQRGQAEAALLAKLSCRDQSIEMLNATVQRLELVVSTLRERQALLNEDVTSHEMERQIAFDDRLCLKSNIERLQETLDVCQADAADLQRRWTAEKESNSSLRQQREALGMAQEDLLAQLHIERQWTDDQLSELASLAREHEKAVADLEEKLASSMEQLRVQREAAAMQLEDSSATFEGLRESMVDEQCALSKHFADELAAAEAREQNLVREHGATVTAMKRDHSDTIARMTDVVDAKSTALEQLKKQMTERENKHINAVNELKAQHLEKQKALEAARADAVKSLDEYKQTMSVSIEEWRRREQAMQAEFEQMRRVQAAQEAKHAELSATLHTQEEKQLRLNETNSALKAEVAQKQARVATLETTTTRLESKIVLLEKERAHHSRQKERQRDMENVSATFSAQQNSQIDAVTAELEKLTREHQALQLEMRACRCSRGENGGATVERDARAVMLSPEEKKDYYRARIRHLEQSAQQQDDKRRELLLVNAKLVQEQKQLHIRNSALMIEIQKLKEKKIGRSRALLRQEWQRKVEHDDAVQQAYAVQSSRHVRLIAASKARATDQMVEETAAGNAERRTGATDQENDQPVKHPDALARESQAGRKRRLDDNTSTAVAGDLAPRFSASNDTAAIPSSSTAATDMEQSGKTQRYSEVRAAIAERTKHRRLAHFFANNKPSAALAARNDDKPTECNQQ